MTGLANTVATILLVLSQACTACDLSLFQDVGSSIAEYACSKETPSQSPVASAADKALETCADGGNTDDLAAQVRDGFAGGQQCDCASAADAVYLHARQDIKTALAGLSNGLEETSSVVRTFSEAHCAPGTVGGVLDQSAEECVTLAQGNTTEASIQAGHAFASAWCTHKNSSEASTMLGNVTAKAVSDAEAACSFTQSVLCSLTDAQVSVIAQAQVEGFARGSADATPCPCSMQHGEVRAIGAVLANATVYLHNAACAASQASFEDMAMPLTERIHPTLQTLALQTPCRSSTGHDMSSAAAAPMPVAAPFGQCGSNDYARTLSFRLAKMVAPAIATSCCTKGYACTVKSRWYASCRPVGEAPRAGWNGTVLELEGCS